MDAKNNGRDDDRGGAAVRPAAAQAAAAAPAAPQLAQLPEDQKTLIQRVCEDFRVYTAGMKEDLENLKPHVLKWSARYRQIRKERGYPEEERQLKAWCFNKTSEGEGAEALNEVAENIRSLIDAATSDENYAKVAQVQPKIDELSGARGELNRTLIMMRDLLKKDFPGADFVKKRDESVRRLKAYSKALARMSDIDILSLFPEGPGSQPSLFFSSFLDVMSQAVKGMYVDDLKTFVQQQMDQFKEDEFAALEVCDYQSKKAAAAAAPPGGAAADLDRYDSDEKEENLF
jgi:hypothetical protein